MEVHLPPRPAARAAATLRRRALDRRELLEGLVLDHCRRCRGSYLADRRLRRSHLANRRGGGAMTGRSSGAAGRDTTCAGGAATTRSGRRCAARRRSTAWAPRGAPRRRPAARRRCAQAPRARCAWAAPRPAASSSKNSSGSGDHERMRRSCSSSRLNSGPSSAGAESSVRLKNGAGASPSRGVLLPFCCEERRLITRRTPAARLPLTSSFRFSPRVSFSHRRTRNATLRLSIA